MLTRFDEDDPADGLMERRWFAIDREAGKLQSECDTLAAVLAMAQDAWLGARSRLTELETVRDTLGRELARRNAVTPAGSHAERAARARTMPFDEHRAESIGSVG
jgi:hypothetical protein